MLRNRRLSLWKKERCDGQGIVAKMTRSDLLAEGRRTSISLRDRLRMPATATFDGFSFDNLPRFCGTELFPDC